MASVLIYQRREAVVTLDGSPSPALARAPVWGDWEGAAGKWLRLYEHNVAGGWDSACYGILKLNVDISGQRSVVGFTLNLPFAGWGTARYRAYLYTSEPTPETSGTSQFYAPSGYIKSLDFVNTNPGSAARNVAFTFTGLNITQSALYLWFEIYHSVTASGEPYWPYTYTFNYSGSSSDVLYANLNDATIAVSYKGIPTSYSVSPSTVSTGGAVNVNISNYFNRTIKQCLKSKIGYENCRITSYNGDYGDYCSFNKSGFCINQEDHFCYDNNEKNDLYKCSVLDMTGN